jgi:Uma2 family endonuclease
MVQAMEPAPAEPADLARYTVERYFTLVDEGVLEPDDRVELLEGVVVSMSARNPLHDTGITLVADALHEAIGRRAVIRVQCSLIIGRFSAPEPDVAVVAGTARDYSVAHPSTALLVVEIADSTLPQDRLTKSRLYAAAGVPEYWIVNLRDGCVEIRREPNVAARAYGSLTKAIAGERIDLIALPGASVAVADLLPDR